MIGQDLDTAIRILKEEELVAIPTETVYGLAGNALSTKAVARIFSVKNRPGFDPLIIHIPSLEVLDKWTYRPSAELHLLAERFMPGPLTLLLPRREMIPDLVTSGSSLVAVRIPAHPMSQALLSALDFPLAAPSANPFGYISPTTATHVADQLGDKIPYILDGGPCAVGLESTIIGLEDGIVTVFRKGGLAVESIEALVGPVQVKAHSSSNPQAPGMLKSHYAPRVPLVFGSLEELTARHAGQRLGILAFQEVSEQLAGPDTLVLSPSGNLLEAAQRLFAAMRALDQRDIELIVAEPLPETGLGRAINDRLRRASSQEKE